MRKLTLFMPGLWGPDVAFHADDLPGLPALNWLLGRGRRQASVARVSPGYDLCALFGLNREGEGDYPIAALTRWSEGGSRPEGLWLRADPAHVAAGRDGLVLFDQRRFDLGRVEAHELAGAVKPLLKPHGLRLEAPGPRRWYIRASARLALKTAPLDAVAGRDILPCMPGGDDRAKLARLLNEIQMTLHDAPVNEQRRQQGLLPINSLWFWGYGALPESIRRRWSFVAGDEGLAKGLALLADIPFQPLPAHYDGLEPGPDNANGLVVINALQRFSDYRDPEGWLAALPDYEANWFMPLQRALQSGRLACLEIRAGADSITLGRYVRLQFWKSDKTLQSFRKR